MRQSVFIALGAATALALSQPTIAHEPDKDFKQALKEEAALLFAAPDAADALAEALAQERRRLEALDEPIDPQLFVGPHRAWIVLEEHRSRDAALHHAKLYRTDGANVSLLELRDGGFEIALGPEPTGRARRALTRWRRAGLVDIRARLSSGSQFSHRIEFERAVATNDPSPAPAGE